MTEIDTDELIRIYVTGLPVDQIAEHLGQKKHNVYNALRKLRLRGVIGRRRIRQPFNERPTPWSNYRIKAGSTRSLFVDYMTEDVARATFKKVGKEGYADIMEYLADLVIDDFYKDQTHVEPDCQT